MKSVLTQVIFRFADEISNGLLDDVALISALLAQKIAAAGLDVFEHEPRFNPEWLNLPNVMLTLHIASASGPTRHRMQQCAVDNLTGVFRNRELNVVTAQLN